MVNRKIAFFAALASALSLPLSTAAAPVRGVYAAHSPNAAFFQETGKVALASGAAPGIALAVVHDGKIVYEGGFGFADVAAKVRATPTTRFAIGSLSKQFTAAIILMLAHERKLSLDAVLANYLPGFANGKTITLRMLLDHTSGLHNYPILSEHPWPTTGPIPTSKIVAILQTDKPDFAPGAKFAYSNANYAVLTAIAEKVSGTSLSALLRARIFNPLVMHHSGFGYAVQQRLPIATGYANGKAEVPPLSLDLFSGAGAVTSTASDLAHWDLALMPGGVFAKNVGAWMLQPGAKTGSGSDTYAMGWVHTSVAGHREIWHNGLAPASAGIATTRSSRTTTSQSSC